MRTKYIVIDVVKKEPEFPNKWHARIKGKTCTIDVLRIGEPAWFSVENLVYAGNSLFHTSYVLGIASDGENLIIETENSTYTLQKVG